MPTSKREMWTEKHRPDSFEDVVGNDGIVTQFEHYSRTGEFPNMILAGPSGTGKSTVTKLLVKKLHGDEYQAHVHSLHGMDIRGVDSIRSRVRPFARSDHRESSPRLVIIKAAEVLVEDAQATLRPLMEDHTNRIRFVLLSNHTAPITAGIQSRCAVYRFSPVEDDAIADRLTEVSNSEGLSITEDALDAITEIADGDLRRAINTLQAVAASDDEPITESNVDRILTSVRPETVKNMLRAALAGDYGEAQIHLDTLLSEGISGDDILVEAHAIARNLDSVDASTLRLINRIGEAKHNLDTGGEASIQISSMLADVARHQN